MSFLGQQTLVPPWGGGSLLPYTLNFTGLLAFPAGWTAPNWTVSANTAKNTPTVGVTELIVNGGFEADSDWVKGEGWSIGDGVASHTGGGSQLYQPVLTVGLWYVGVANFVRSGGILRLYVGGYGPPRTSSGLYSESRRATSNRGGAAADTNGIGTVDNVSVKNLTSLLAYRNFSIPDARIGATGSISTGYQSGVVARVSADASQYLLAYHDLTTCYLLKVLTAGTTQLIGITTAYVAGVLPEIRCSGDTIQLFYNGSQVGTDQTETTLSANTRHGLFSTDVSNTFSTFTVVRN